MNSVEIIALGKLEAHPWQANIPNLVGKEWTEFLADVRSRGVQDPIRVSTRTGAYVVVDGHQRLRAALEVGYTGLVALIQNFADEGEEVEYIAGSSRYRRNLTDAQRVGIGRAREAYFSSVAKVGRPKGGTENLYDTPEKRKTIIARLEPTTGGHTDPITKRFHPYDCILLRGEGEDKLTSIEVNFDAHSRQSSSKAAEAVGLSRATYERGKKIQSSAPSSVLAAWEDETLSTHAAHELATKAPEPVRAALEAKTLTAIEAATIQKNAEVRGQLERGEITVEQALTRSAQMKAERERMEKETGLKAFNRATALMTSIKDFTASDYLEVLYSFTNAKMNGDFAEDWASAIQHMLGIAQAAKGQAQAVTIDSRAVN